MVKKKIIRNLFLIAVLCVGLWYFPKHMEYNNLLDDVGIERADLTSEYIWKCKGHSDILYIEAWYKRPLQEDEAEAGTEWVWLQLQRTYPLHYYGHFSDVEVGDNMVSWIMNDRIFLNEEEQRYHVWDKVSTFPPLPMGSMICMTELEEENLWRVDIDCLEPDYEYFAVTEGGLEHFVPELTYTVDRETGEIQWIYIDERCEEMKMVPDTEVIEKTMQVMEYHWLNYFVEA